MSTKSGQLQSMDFSLATSGSNATGTGVICGVGPECRPGPVSITGTWSDGTFQLTFQGTGFVATLSGHLVGDNELDGTWSGAYSGNSIFYRH